MFGIVSRTNSNVLSTKFNTTHRMHLAIKVLEMNRVEIKKKHFQNRGVKVYFLFYKKLFSKSKLSLNSFCKQLNLISCDTIIVYV